MVGTVIKRFVLIFRIRLKNIKILNQKKKRITKSNGICLETITVALSRFELT